MMRRKVKKRHWGWIAAAVIALLVIIMPVEMFVTLMYETQQKAEITEALLVTLTSTAKAGVVFLSGVAALIFYRMMNK